MTVMKHHLIALLLFIGVLPLVLSLPRKYILIKQEKTWSDAQAYCKDKDTDLAIITTNDEMNNLKSVAQKQQLSSVVWIGLYTNINEWYWSFENELVGSFTSWTFLEPNDLYGNELCGVIVFGNWLDAQCSMLLSFVCFDDRPSATETYVLITQGKSWYDAQSYCRQHHTDLASARDATEKSAVAAKNFWFWTWFGLVRHPWKWTDQTTDVSEITWWGGNIYDYWENKSCVYLYGFVANVEQCSKTLPFFCSAFPVQQQIIRMKLKSSEDVNDPAITSAIDEKLKQKLQEHGMTENITMTWRKQPDGKVFHKEVENITTGTNATEAGDC